MNNLSFSEKNGFIVRQKSGKYFFKDLELFKKHFPNHRLNNELARANSFTYERLDGQILFELLNRVSPEEILLNRSKETEKTPAKPVIENTDQAKEELRKMGIDPEKISPEFLQTNIGMNLESFTDLFLTLKKEGDRAGLDGLEIHTLQLDPTDSPSDPIDETHSPNTTETIDPNVDSPVTDEKINRLEDRIDELEENLYVDESELSDLRDELSNNQISVDELSEKIEALEKKAFNKKKTGKKNSRK